MFPARIGSSSRSSNYSVISCTSLEDKVVAVGHNGPKWVLLWLSPHQKCMFGRRTAAAARPRNLYVDGHRPLVRGRSKNLPPSRRRQRRHAASIPLPTCFCFETEPTPTTARRLSAPPTGGTAARAAPLEERKRGHVVCRVEKHGGVVVLGVGLSQRSWVRLTRARRRQWSIFPLCAALSHDHTPSKGARPRASPKIARQRPSVPP